MHEEADLGCLCNSHTTKFALVVDTATVLIGFLGKLFTQYSMINLRTVSMH